MQNTNIIEKTNINSINNDEIYLSYISGLENVNTDIELKANALNLTDTIDKGLHLISDKLKEEYINDLQSLVHKLKEKDSSRETLEKLFSNSFELMPLVTGISYSEKETLKINNLKSEILDLYANFLKIFFNKDTVTKWDTTFLYLSTIYKNGYLQKEIYELLSQMNQLFILDSQITNEQIATFNSNVKLLKPKLISSIYSTTFEFKLIFKEINKKQRLFYNRLNRVVDSVFGGWLKNLRKEKGWTLQQLEDYSGVTASYIYRLEAGKKKTPSIPIAKKLANAFEISEQDFLKRLGLTNSDNALTENLDLVDFLTLSQNYTLSGKNPTDTERESLIDLFKNILSSSWTNDTKVTECSNILVLIDKFKKAQ